MRITGGKLKNRKIKSPPGDSPGVRPTMDALRESLFSILDQYTDWSSAQVLDLFSGSGSLGLESISRGAKQVTFVERNEGCRKTILDNIQSMGLSDIPSISLKGICVFKFLDSEEGKFSLIFADPPFGAIHVEEFLCKLSESSILAPGSIVVFEGDSKQLGKFLDSDFSSPNPSDKPDLIAADKNQPGSFVFESGVFQLLRFKKYAAAAVCIFCFCGGKSREEW